MGNRWRFHRVLLTSNHVLLKPMLTIEQMRSLSLYIQDGKRIVVFTQRGVYAFRTQREARLHPSYKLAHIALRLRDIAGGLYVDTTPLYGAIA